MQRIGVLGSGNVGTVLANGFLKHGYAVVRGSREPAKLGDWLEQAGPNARTGRSRRPPGPPRSWCSR
jgi:predicted dinucleotide-binding enzyme